jgi:hypothetical protein
MSHPIRCQCGAFRGEVGSGASVIHAVCYCKDCRAYAIHLGKPDRVLDAMGGTEVVATQARHVSFTHGAGDLACLSLGPKGVLRWYARCCHTPIANTPRDWRLPYVGFVHSSLAKPLETSFPPVQMHVNTRSAKGKPPAMIGSEALALLGFLPRLIAGRLTGSYRRTPFFSGNGVPVVSVQLLTPAERELATRAALAFSRT